MHSCKHKLRSQAGSSILLALMFMLIITFVGGSVLVSATGNAGRLNRMRERRQLYLSQRSAAILLKEQLSFQTGANRLTIETQQTKTTITDNTSGLTNTSVDVTKSPKVTPPAADKCSNLHPLLFQTAVSKYFNDVLVPQSNGAQLENPVPNDDWFGESAIPKTPISGEISMQVVKAGNVSETVSGTYTCEFKNEGRTMLFRVSFGQISVVVRGDIRTTQIPVTPETTVVGNIRTEVQQSGEKTVITWQAPTIVKGGAA